jgi:hypothetical protein
MPQKMILIYKIVTGENIQVSSLLIQLVCDFDTGI